MNIYILRDSGIKNSGKAASTMLLITLFLVHVSIYRWKRVYNDAVAPEPGAALVWLSTVGLCSLCSATVPPKETPRRRFLSQPSQLCLLLKLLSELHLILFSS